MKKSGDDIVIKSSGNVFADIGVHNPEEALAKAKLMRLIAKAIEADGLTQTDAAQRLGVAQSDVSNIVRGRGRTYSMDRLFEILHRLGVKITIEAAIGTTKARISVFA
jgi:predicted XRE-type DNA-binding protein